MLLSVLFYVFVLFFLYYVFLLFILFLVFYFFFFQAEDGIRDYKVTGVQTCALPICPLAGHRELRRHARRAGGHHPAGSGSARSGTEPAGGRRAEDVRSPGQPRLSGAGLWAAGRGLREHIASARRGRRVPAGGGRGAVSLPARPVSLGP